MGELTLLILVVATSLGAYLFGTGWMGLSATGLRSGTGRLVEAVGIAVVFFVLNVAVVLVITLVLRSMGRFASLYVATDPTLMVLSSIQAAAFQFWRYSNGHKGKE